jgi:D-3-phosphoglycerate dehydrogenase
MVGHVGTVLGRHGVNIVSAAVGRQPDDLAAAGDRTAVMAITTDSPVPREVIDEIVAGEGFQAGHTVTL